jgi:hypothetical protein
MRKLAIHVHAWTAPSHSQETLRSMGASCSLAKGAGVSSTCTLCRLVLIMDLHVGILLVSDLCGQKVLDMTCIGICVAIYSEL